MVGIFSRSFFVGDVLQELERTSQSSHPIFDDLLDDLSVSGLRIAYVAAHSRKDSMCRSASSNQREPTLSLYVADRHSFAAMGVNERDSNWNSSYAGTEAIIANWSSLCQRYGLTEEYFSATMLVFIYNLQALQLNVIVRTCKPLIDKYFEDCSNYDSGFQEPSYIFVSSEPAIRVFYRCPEELRDQTKIGNTVRHKQAIRKSLAENDVYDCYESELVTIEFLDCETERDNMYGYSRED